VAPLGQVLGNCPAILALREEVDRLLRQVGARRPPAVLILGETGSGKGLLARELHRAGPRREGPFVALNCAAVPESLLEAELFGFERGAFTDARHAKPGLLQTAHHGTLLLDEIALLPPAIQPKLLTAIEERTVRRLGSVTPESVDVWIIAATNADLVTATRRGTFREDLYHRLAVLTLTVPPLRERGDDIVLLAERFLAKACADYGLPAKTLGREARAALLAYPWPGNIRELGNVIERVALVEESSHLTAEMLRLPSTRAPDVTAAGPAPAAPPSLKDSVSDLERARLLQAFDETGWNVSRTAERLGISRNQVRYRIEKYQLRPEVRPRRRSQSVPAAPDRDITPPPTATWSPWERRHLAFVGVSLVATAGGEDSFDTSGALASHVEKLQGFGGVVEEVGPTRVIVTFGLDPIEDAPARAALAALAIRQAAEPRDAIEPHASAVTLAIHVAAVLIGGPGGTPHVDRDSGRAAVGVLEALLARREVGAILVSDLAAPFLARRFEMAPAERADGAGACLRLVGRERSGFGLGGRVLSPFVGRAHELDAVAALAARVAQGRGQVLGIVGEPGVGKSRFTFEVSRLEGLRGWRVLGCAATSHGAATPYLPIRELLRTYFELDDSETRLELRARVVDKARTLGPALEADLPAWLSLLELPVDDARWAGLDPTRQRQHCLDAVKRLWLRESERQPLLLILEDLHWGDSETQAVLDTLEESLPAAHILLLVTYRTGFRHAWTDRTYYTQLRLDPLTSEGTAELLRQLLGDDRSLGPVAALVTDRCEGNAFFLEETVRMLAETGVLAGEPGARRLAEPVHGIKVPGTVQALLAARIDRLSPGDKQVLQTAAVIGRDVPLALLEALVGVSHAETLREALRRLRAAEFLYEVSLAGEPGYTFKHALTHDVAYESLSEGSRRTLHVRVVEAIHALYGDRLGEQTERLAHHAACGELWDRALAFAQQAGHRAAARCAFREAVAAFEQALVALEHLPRSRESMALDVDLRFELRNVLISGDDVHGMQRHLEAAEPLAMELGDRARLARVLVYRSTLLWLSGDHASAIARASTALEIAGVLGDTELEVMARVHLGAPHYARGEYRQAVAHLERAIALSGGERLHQRLGLSVIASVQSRRWLVCCLAELGAFDEGIRRGDEAIRIADSVGHLTTQSSARRAVGFLHLVRGAPSAAMPYLDETADLGGQIPVGPWFETDRFALGFAYVAAGRVDQGFRILRGADPTFRLELIQRLAWLAEAHLLAGRVEESARVADEALTLARDRHERGHEAWLVRLQAEIALAHGPSGLQTGEAAYRQALDLAEQLEMRPLVAQCHLGLGRVHRQAGRVAAARAELDTALAMFRAMDMDTPARRAEAELAECVAP
jgi:DNA-binding NtrC family response regulator/tetratricopeptide (TPR) repeat protein